MLTALVTIGDGQRGGWAIRVGGKTTKGSDPVQVALGDGAALQGKVVQVVVTVVDVRPETNRLSAIVEISGGPGGALAVEQTVDDGGDGDVAMFTTVVLFE